MFGFRSAGGAPETAFPGHPQDVPMLLLVSKGSWVAVRKSCSGKFHTVNILGFADHMQLLMYMLSIYLHLFICRLSSIYFIFFFAFLFLFLFFICVFIL